MGWLLALRGWRPGNAHTSLVTRIKGVRVGGTAKEEAKQLAFLDTLGAEQLRSVLHLATEAEMLAEGLPVHAVAAIERALPSQAEGFQRIAALRREGNNRRTAAFATLKHMNAAQYQPELAGYEIFVPARFELRKAKGDPTATGHLDPLTIATDAEAVKSLAASAMSMQAVRTPPWQRRAGFASAWNLNYGVGFFHGRPADLGTIDDLGADERRP